MLGQNDGDNFSLLTSGFTDEGVREFGNAVTGLYNRTLENFFG